MLQGCKWHGREFIIPSIRPHGSCTIQSLWNQSTRCLIFETILMLPRLERLRDIYKSGASCSTSSSWNSKKGFNAIELRVKWLIQIICLNPRLVTIIDWIEIESPGLNRLNIARERKAPLSYPSGLGLASTRRKLLVWIMGARYQIWVDGIYLYILM